MGRRERLASDTALLYAILFVIVGTIVGGLVHNPFDPQRYAKGAIGIYQGVNIYQLRGVVYPPLLYASATIILYPLSLVTPIETGSYLVIATFAGIGATVQAFSYTIGDKLVAEDNSIRWLIASLLNPFVLYVVVLFGQMESLVILGVVGVIYAEKTNRWSSGSALLAVASAVKIYPAILFFPFIFRNREYTYQIIRGAAPVALLTALLMIPFLPESLMIFFSAFWGIQPVNALYILSLATVPSWLVSVVFAGTFVLSGVIAATVELDDYIYYLIPLVPVVLFYPDVIEYRWLPLAVGALLVGYLPGNASSTIRDICRRYGWLWILLGTIAMIIGTIESWQRGDPWLILTEGTQLELWAVSTGWYPVTAIPKDFVAPFLIDMARVGVAIVFIGSVINWCRLIYHNSRISLLRGVL